MTGDPTTLLTVLEAAKILKVSANHVRRLIHGGRLPGVNIAVDTCKGRAEWRVKRVDLDRFIELGGN